MRPHPLRQIASSMRKGPWEVTFHRFGTQDAMVIDDFYADYEVLRELVLGLDFIDIDKTAKYPGRRASTSLDQSQFLQEELDTDTSTRGQKRQHQETGIDFLPFAPSAEMLAVMRERGYSPAAPGAYTKFIQELLLSKVPRMDELRGWWALHEDDFGDTPETVRLTQNIFFTP